MKKILFATILITSVLFTACNKQPSGTVDQDLIYTSYEVFYNKNSDKTIAVARFRFGGATGTLLELEDNAYVTYAGDTLQYNILYSGHVKEYAGLNFGGTFEYKNNDGITYTNNSISFDSIAFPASFDTLYKTTAYDLTWDGSSLSSGENVGIFIGSWTWGQDALLIQNTAGANNIVIGTNNMNSLAVGPATAYMDRSNVSININGTSEGGRITSKYRALNTTVQVLD